VPNLVRRSSHTDAGTFSRALLSQIGVTGACPAVVASCCGTLSPVSSSRSRLGFGSLKHRSPDPRIPSNLTFPSRKKRYSNTADGQNLFDNSRPLGSEYIQKEITAK